MPTKEIALQKCTTCITLMHFRWLSHFLPWSAALTKTLPRYRTGRQLLNALFVLSPCMKNHVRVVDTAINTGFNTNTDEETSSNSKKEGVGSPYIDGKQDFKACLSADLRHGQL